MTPANANDIARAIGSYMTVSDYNHSVFREAQKNLMSFVESDGTYVYLVQPDGTKTRILPGAKLQLYEITPIGLMKAEEC
jgi:hypothetical protein